MAVFAADDTGFPFLGGWDLALRAALRLGAAALLGALLGWTRQRLHKAAGVRTHMLVCLGSALFSFAPQQFGFAIEQVVQGVATGVGFIGAGAILKQQDEHDVKGLTTAASIWVTAAVGVAVGLGYIWPAAVAAVLAWVVLVVVGGLEQRLEGPGR